MEITDNEEAVVVSNDERMNDELDDILGDLGFEIDQIKPDRVRLDHTNQPKNQPYVTLESPAESADEDLAPMPAPTPVTDEKTEDAFATMTFDAPDEDVQIYAPAEPTEEEAAEPEIDTDATQLIPVPVDDDEDGKKKGKKKPRRERKKKEIPPEDLEESTEEEVESYRKMVRGEVWGCLKTILYIVLVIAIAVGLATYIIRAGLDFTGIGGSSRLIDITIEEGASTEQIAETLAAHEIIRDPFIFRVYCRVFGEDGTFHPGVHTVSANMGYDGVVTELQKVEVRETVQVTIPEGTTVEGIVDILEENEVCNSKDFYSTMLTVDFGIKYDFIGELTPAERENRVYLLEGYLFPDTYDFYKNGSAETVICTMLDNFASRVNADTRAAIKESGKTLNEILIEASIIQMEAGFKEDMPRVARVTQNRLDNPDEFPLLQMDSTRDYLKNLMSASDEAAAMDTYYNTYVREGLPVGSICNPGLDAINAALNPSEEPNIINCFYFASIVETGETQFFETFAAHEAWCTEHGVGMYG